MRARYLAPSGFVPLSKDMPSLVMRRFKLKTVKITETHSSGGIEELLWVANGLADDAGAGLSDGGNARNAMTGHCWVSSMAMKVSRAPLWSIRAKDLASAFEPSRATATARHHRPNAVTL